MDNGEVIPGLNEDWTFAGAKIMEWICGFVNMVIVSSAFDKPAKVAPLLLATMVFTTFGMATLRRRFPDEERGLRNQCMTALGLEPPGIPRPAQLQPYWSGAPTKDLDEKALFKELGLHEVFPAPTLEDEYDVEQFYK